MPAGIIQSKVLIGVKVQCALYPIRHNLLALSDGIIVETAIKVKNKVIMNNTQYPFFLIFIFYILFNNIYNYWFQSTKEKLYSNNHNN